jgi:Tfp pilus assembly protein PilF
MGILLIIFITGLVYSNTFNAAWHFDDYSNIIDNPGAHPIELNFKAIIQSLYASIDLGAYKGDSLYRPVAMFTFALNWCAGEDRVFGYHIVNILIHIFSGIFLFLTLRLILATPRVDIKDESVRYQAALLTAVLWTVHPINTSAVTYIIQRMASLAGMFYIAGLYFYLKFRQAGSADKKAAFFCMFAAAGGLAFFSKENTVLILPSTLLLEAIFFQEVTIKSLLKPKIIMVVLALVFFLTVVAAIWTGNDIFRLISGFENRTFGPVERLMTQSRVICLYLSQIFYPLSSQFSMVHDIAVSKTLFSPWTTLPSILFVISLFVSGVVLQKKYPLAGFAILFFFLNHAIESTVLNLELVFEHRNYVPSMFLFAPLSVGVVTCLSRYQKKQDKKFIFVTGCFFIAALIATVGMGSYTRNFDWRTEKSLWEAALEKAPRSARPYQCLARYYYEEIGDWQTAAGLYETSIPLDVAQGAYTKSNIFDRLHFVYLQMGNVEKALEYGKKSVETKMVQPFAMNYIKTLLTQNRLTEAESVFRKLFAQEKTTVEALNLLTRMYLQGHQAVKALRPALAAFKRAPFDAETITYWGYVNMVNNQVDRAERYFKKALSANTRHDFFVRLCLIQNSINQGNGEKNDFFTRQLLDNYPVQQIFNGLKMRQARQDLPVLLEIDKIRNAVVVQMGEKQKEIETFQFQSQWNF